MEGCVKLQAYLVSLLEKCKINWYFSFNFFGGMNYCSTFAASNNNKDVRKDYEQCIAYYSRGGPSSH